jgi:hypothetical protein
MEDMKNETNERRGMKGKSRGEEEKFEKRNEEM